MFRVEIDPVCSCKGVGRRLASTKRSHAGITVLFRVGGCVNLAASLCQSETCSNRLPLSYPFTVSNSLEMAAC